MSQRYEEFARSSYFGTHILAKYSEYVMQEFNLFSEYYFSSPLRHFWKLFRAKYVIQYSYLNFLFFK
jgi:hypothetical protein